MTKEQLKEYRSSKAEINELRYNLCHMGDGDTMIGNDTIFNYNSGYPVPQAVIGVDWTKVDRTESKYNKRIASLEKKCHEVEAFIDEIPDSLTRRIFRMRFIEGLDQQKIADILSLERSTVSKKITSFLKLSHKSHNSHL